MNKHIPYGQANYFIIHYSKQNTFVRERRSYNKYDGAICVNKTVMENPKHTIPLSQAGYPGELSEVLGFLGSQLSTTNGI